MRDLLSIDASIFATVLEIGFAVFIILTLYISKW